MEQPEAVSEEKCDGGGHPAVDAKPTTAIDMERNNSDELTELSEASKTKILRKIDLHLLLPLWVVFVFGFVDRINLGNVAVLGIVEELGLKHHDFNIAMQTFFVPYILFDIPSNIILKKSKPSTWMALLSFMWGIAAMCQGFVKNNSGLTACRFFVGVFEAGYVPGTAYLMSAFYRRHELQKRLSLFWVAGLVAAAFGGLLAYALNHMGGLAGYSGWRWIFIVEGLVSIVLSVPAKFFIADWPEQARFLDTKEKHYVLSRTSEDLGGGARMDRLDAAAWKRILTDWKIYIATTMYFTISVSGSASSLFIPSIMFSLGYSGVQSQVQSIPIWLAAASVTLIVSYFTDRMKHRYGFIMFGVLFCSIGYIFLLCQGSRDDGLPFRVRHMGVFFVCVGTYIAQPIILVWLANNLGGHYKRAIGLAIQIGLGNAGGIVASNIFVREDSPRYFPGYGVALAMVVVCGIMSTTFAVGLMIENRKREQGKRDYRLQLDESILENMGDDDPRFRFTL